MWFVKSFAALVFCFLSSIKRELFGASSLLSLCEKIRVELVYYIHHPSVISHFDQTKRHFEQTILLKKGQWHLHCNYTAALSRQGLSIVMAVCL